MGLGQEQTDNRLRRAGIVAVWVLAGLTLLVVVRGRLFDDRLARELRDMTPAPPPPPGSARFEKGVMVPARQP